MLLLLLNYARRWLNLYFQYEAKSEAWPALVRMQTAAKIKQLRKERHERKSKFYILPARTQPTPRYLMGAKKCCAYPNQLHMTPTRSKTSPYRYMRRNCCWLYWWAVISSHGADDPIVCAMLCSSQRFSILY